LGAPESYVPPPRQFPPRTRNQNPSPTGGGGPEIVFEVATTFEAAHCCVELVKFPPLARRVESDPLTTSYQDDPASALHERTTSGPDRLAPTENPEPGGAGVDRHQLVRTVEPVGVPLENVTHPMFSPQARPPK